MNLSKNTKLCIFILTIIVLGLGSFEEARAAVEYQLHGWNGTDWIPVNTDETGNLEMSANISSASWNNLLDIPASFADNIDNTGPPTWQQGTDTIYNDSSGIQVGIGISTPTHTLNIVGDSNFTANTTFESDVIILGTLFGASPLKVGGGIQLIDSNLNLTNGNITTSDGTVILATDDTGNLTVDNDLIVNGLSYLGQFQIQDDLIIGSNNFSSSYIGIGTTSPEYELDIRGKGNFTDDVTIGNFFVDVSAGNVGIGTTSPTHTLNVDGTANFTKGDFLVENASGEVGLFYDESQGMVGIGTTSVGKKLTIFSATGDDQQLRLGTATNNYWDIGRENTLTGDFQIKSFTGSTPATPFVIALATGNVGIGTTSPTHTLHVEPTGGANPIANFTSTDNTGYILIGEDTNYASLGVDDANFFITNSNVPATASHLVIDTSGNVGIGNTAPIVKLEVSDSASNTNAQVSTWSTTNSDTSQLILLKSASATINTKAETADGEALGTIKAQGIDTGSNTETAAEIAFEQDGAAGTRLPGRITFTTATGSAAVTERMRIDSSGNVGIGTTSPYSQLELSGGNQGGNLSLSNTLNVNTWTIGDKTNVINFRIADTTGGFPDDGEGVGARISAMAYAVNGNAWGLAFDTNNNAADASTKMVISNAGNVGIGTTTPTHTLNVVGDINATGDIYKNGATALDWVFDAYFDGYINCTKAPDAPGCNHGKVGDNEVVGGVRNGQGISRDYQLPSISALAQYVEQNRHLPNLNKEKYTGASVEVGILPELLLQKVEELTLYTLEQQEMILQLQAEVNTLKQQNPPPTQQIQQNS